MNRVTLIGRLTRDPDSHQAGSSQVAKWSLAINKRFKNEKTGEWESIPTFVNLVTWAGKATYQYDLVMTLKKGQLVLADGELRSESWTDKTTGQKRTAITVATFSVSPLQETEKPPQNQGPGRSTTPHAEEMAF